jgi:hypothetical protein
MAAKDRYHEPFKRALTKAGWVITHDPLVLPWLATEVEIDLGAEWIISAEHDGVKIAIEVKSFLSKSSLADFEQALGQFIVYLDALAIHEPARTLYLAVPLTAFNQLVRAALTQLTVVRHLLRVVVYDPTEEVITQWIPDPLTTAPS